MRDGDHRLAAQVKGSPAGYIIVDSIWKETGGWATLYHKFVVKGWGEFSSYIVERASLIGLIKAGQRKT